MPLRSRIRSIVRNLLFRRRVERDLDEELRAYVEMDIDEKQRAGAAEDDARRRALVEFGGIDQVKERVRDVRAGALADEVYQDVAYAVRLLRKHASFTTVALATLALGVGAATAVFSVVDTVVFRPLPYEHPERLVKICGTSAADRACDDDFSASELEALRRTSGVFEQVAGDDGRSATLGAADGGGQPIGVGLVTDDWLSTLGVRPLIGRDFQPDEARVGHDRVVILTHDYWRRHFNSDPGALGTTLTLDGTSHTVIGVLPRNVLRDYADVLIPLDIAEYRAQSLDVFARLKPGWTLAQAGAAVAAVGRHVEPRTGGADLDRRLTVEPLGKYYASVPRRATEGLLLMLLAVGMLVLIACANVATLLLARGSGRRHEALIRAALGASRGRLVRQFLVESLVLSVVGGALGVLVARLSIGGLTALAVSGGYVPDHLEVTADLRVLGVSLALSLVTGLAFGLVPALQASNIDLRAGVRESSGGSGGQRRGRAGRLLVVAELALTLVLLAGFGLLIRSFQQVYAASGGFDPDNVLITGSDAGQSFADAVAFWRGALERARAVPGIASAALTSRPPIAGARHTPFLLEGQAIAAETALSHADDVLVSPDYFRTMQIPVLKGRAFTNADTGSSQPVVIVSESLARRYFGGANVIGRRIRLLDQSPLTCCSAPAPVDHVWRDVVGIVGDVRQAGLDDAPAVTIYRPYTQIVEHDMFLVVRAASPSQAGRVTADLRGPLASVDPARHWSSIRPMWQIIRTSGSIRLRRFVLILLGGFAAAGLLLAALGVYGVASRVVADRTREIGLRIALGATRPSVFFDVFRRMMVLAAGGAAIGIATAFALARLIRTMLFGVGPADGVTYLGAALLLAVVVLLASGLPARKAARVDPIVALKSD